MGFLRSVTRGYQIRGNAMTHHMTSPPRRGVLPDLSGTMIFRAQSVLGSLTGTVADLHDVVELAQSGRLAATPVEEYPKGAANDALMMLQHGRVTGRAVLVS